MQRVGWSIGGAFIAIALITLSPQYASAQQDGLSTKQGTVTREHGIYLDSKHRVMIVQERGEVTIYLMRRSRAEGGPLVLRTEQALALAEENELPEVVIRFQEAIPLMRLRSEVVVPSEPNYLQNPGQRYRVFVDGMDVAPDYQRQFEVNAEEALQAVFSETANLYSRTFGVRADALFYGMAIAANELNKTGYLPARIPSTVLRSAVGRFRIGESTFQRREVERVTRFDAVRDGSGFRSELAEDSALSDALSPEALGRASTRGGISATGAQLSQRDGFQLGDFEGGSGVRTRGATAPRLRGSAPRPGQRNASPELETPRLGQRGTSLTEEVEDIPPLPAAQFDTLELLVGELPANPLQPPPAAGPQAGGARP